MKSRMGARSFPQLSVSAACSMTKYPMQKTYELKQVAKRNHSGRARNSGLCAVQNSYVSGQRKQSLVSSIGAEQ